MPLTPSRTREILESLQHRPRKNLGHNFLVDGNIVRKSMQLANLRTGDCVVEVGPGLGTLTEAMLEIGCRVHAVELDKILAGYLRTNLEERFPDSFRLIEADAVQHPCAGITGTNIPFKIVANLPYAITTPWLEAVLRGQLPTDMVLMMQKEAASRITAQPGTKSFGAISVFVGAAYDRMATHNVSRSCFYPVPGVDSILLHLRLKPDFILLPQNVRDLIRTLFTNRRKQVGSLLMRHKIPEVWLDELAHYGCSGLSRPEEIPVAAWLALSKVMNL
jgi:16S rRNA (adenine1518-N6/adenine1519-N6)-dimethyltransferase